MPVCNFNKIREIISQTIEKFVSTNIAGKQNRKNNYGQCN